MELTDVIGELKEYNEWRRGADIKQPNPTRIGLVIDKAIKLLSDMEEGEKLDSESTEEAENVFTDMFSSMIHDFAKIQIKAAKSKDTI